jgi:hypothetical protein
VYLRLPAPEIGRQPALNSQMIELKLDRGNVAPKITAGIGCAYMKSCNLAADALSFHNHNKPPLGSTAINGRFPE